MGKRKKRILFDVIGGEESEREFHEAVRPPKRRRAEPVLLPAPEGDIRMTYGMAGTVAVAFLVVVGLAYYLGHHQGARGLQPDTQSQAGPGLRHDVGPSAGGEAAVYGVRACQVPFTRYTYDSLIEEFRGHVQRLEGFPEPEVRRIDDPEVAGAGRLVLWVGRGGSREDLDELADRLRRLSDGRGDQPFKNAWVLPRP